MNIPQTLSLLQFLQNVSVNIGHVYTVPSLLNFNLVWSSVWITLPANNGLN